MPKKRADSVDEADDAPMADEQNDESSTSVDNSAEKDEDSKDEPPLKRRKSEENESEKKERSPELAKLWKAAEDDPSDFTAWTYLLQHVDTLSDADAGREAYDAFLFRYPYCYGYWKKYADFEKCLGEKEKCMMVFERGIKAIPLSADLWLHYLNHVKAEYAESPAFVRAQYERAVAACGREWRSDKLWDNFVKWEKEQKELTNVLKLYDRILANPTQGLSHQFEMFREFLKENSPKDILDVDDFLEMRKDVLEALEKEKGQADEVDADAENTALREKVLFSRKKTYKATEEKVQARWKFEDNIKRPYFHMKPLERGQLKNWTEYLDFEIAEQAKEDGDPAVVETLFERCLIACALYEDFWLKYLSWLRDLPDGAEKTRSMLERACTHHLPSKVDIHVQWSAFEERAGDHDKAAEILRKVHKHHPEMLSLVMRIINLERRRGNVAKVHELYNSSIAEATKREVKSDLSVKYSRYLRLDMGDAATAAQVIDSALAADESNAKLYLQRLDILLHARPLDVAQIVQVLDTAMAKCEKSPKQRLLFSQRKVEFLEDFGLDIDELLRVQDAHTKLSAEVKAAAKTEKDAHNKTEGDAASAKENKGQYSNGGTPASTTTYPAANSASYGAYHNSQYQQYGSRYTGTYGQGGYGQYNSYYGGYGSGGSGY